ncbi:MAG TPA: DUF480 domain-containing protein [Fimbriiglobus sp.]|jgi:hypothetical protein
MSDPVSAPVEPLSPHERRVLGVLIEKQKTSKSPDAYPMTLNSLTTGCNQKSNRDPVLDLTDDTVEEVLGDLQKKGLVMRMTGGRTDRFRHLLYEAWRVGKVEMAVLAELLLRGPQSIGDLRGRASRMDDIADLDVLRSILAPLAERKLVVFLTDPNRRGASVTHGFHAVEELETARTEAGHLKQEEVPSRPASIPRLSDSLVEDVESLKAAVVELKVQVDEMRKQLGLG